MNPLLLPPLPAETADVARSVFNIQNVYLAIGDQIEDLLTDITLADLDASGEKQADALCLSAMVTIFQYAEDLPDRLAAEAIHERTDWKYALHLSLDYPGFDPNMLCQFRQRLLQNNTGQQVFQSILNRLAGVGLLNRRARELADGRDILMAVCTLSRLDQLVQAMSQTLEALAASQPELLLVVTLPHWYDRYYPLTSTINLPRTQEGQEALVQAIGKDSWYLLEVITENDVPELAQMPEVRSLRQTWHQQFAGNGSEATWRESCSYCHGFYAPDFRNG